MAQEESPLARAEKSGSRAGEDPPKPDPEGRHMDWKPIRIVAVTAFPPMERGESEYARLLFEEVASRPAIQRVEVVTFRDALQRNGSEPRWRTKNIRLHPVMRSEPGLRALNGLLAMPSLVVFRPDVVHLVGPLNPSLYGGGIGEGVLPLMLAARILRVRVVTSLHITYSRAVISSKVRQRVGGGVLFALIRRALTVAIRLILDLSTVVLVVSSQDSPELLERIGKDFGVALDKLQFELHPNMLHGVSGVALPEARIFDDRPFVLCFGFFRPEKAFENALLAWSERGPAARPYRLVLAGPAIDVPAKEYVAKLRAIVTALDLEPDVRFVVRFLDVSEVSWLLRKAGAFLAPYAHTQGPSGTVLAALSCGTPVVVAQTGMSEEQLKGWDCVWVYPTPEGIVKGIEEALLKKRPPQNALGGNSVAVADTAAGVLAAYIGQDRVR